MKKILFLLSIVSALSFNGTAYASETYCVSTPLHIVDGSDVSADWKITSALSRKPQIPGQQKPTTGCSNNWNSLGAFYKPIEIIQKPKLGSAKIGPRYRIFYSSNKVGNDELVVRIHWVADTTTQLSSAIVRYHIIVFDHSL